MQLNSRVTKLGQELKEEQEMNRCLRANQAQLQSQLAEEERKGKESGEWQRDENVTDSCPSLWTGHSGNRVIVVEDGGRMFS